MKHIFVFRFVFPSSPHVATSAEVRLKKQPIKEANFSLNVNIKDNAGVGVTQAFEGESSAYYKAE